MKGLSWREYGGFPKLGVPFWGSQDYNILGPILRYPYFGKLPYYFEIQKMGLRHKSRIVEALTSGHSELHGITDWGWCSWLFLT